MKRPIICSALTLIMPALLFAGCRRISPNIDYALLGTWRSEEGKIKKVYRKEDGEIVKEEILIEGSFPEKNIKDDSILYRPYYQITRETIKEYYEIEGYEKIEGKFFCLMDEVRYFVQGNRIISLKGELIYSLEGDELTLFAILYTREESYSNEETGELEVRIYEQIMESKYVKVEDSVITPVYHIDEFEDLKDLFDDDNEEP